MPPREVHLRPGASGVWWASFQGSVTAIRDVKGLHYLRLLLQRPAADIPAIVLSDTVAGDPGSQAAGGDLGAVLDQQALSAYRRRLSELEADLGEARSWADTGRAAKLAAERDALLEQLRAATGLGGRPRQPGSAGERARIAVRKAIASAIGRLSAVDPALGRILSATVTTGTICRYDPDPDRPVRWILSSEDQRRQPRLSTGRGKRNRRCTEPSKRVKQDQPERHRRWSPDRPSPQEMAMRNTPRARRPFTALAAFAIAAAGLLSACGPSGSGSPVAQQSPKPSQSPVSQQSPASPAPSAQPLPPARSTSTRPGSGM